MTVRLMPSGSFDPDFVERLESYLTSQGYHSRGQCGDGQELFVRNGDSVKLGVEEVEVHYTGLLANRQRKEALQSELLRMNAILTSDQIKAGQLETQLGLVDDLPGLVTEGISNGIAGDGLNIYEGRKEE